MGEIGVIPALEDFFDRILGRGDAAITVPTFDGSLKPNQLLERAEVVAEFAEPEDLAASTARSISPTEQCCAVATGSLVARGPTFRAADHGVLRPARRPARSGAGRHGSQGIWRRSKGPMPGKVISGGGMCAVNALAPGPDGSLLATDGSANEPYRGLGARSPQSRTQRQVARDQSRDRRGQREGVRAALRVRRGGSGERRAGQRKLAASPGRGRRRRVGAERARPFAGLSFPHGARFRRRLLAHGLHREDAAVRVRPARSRLSQAHDEGSATGVLGRRRGWARAARSTSRCRARI